MKYGDRRGDFPNFNNLMQFSLKKNKNQITYDIQMNLLLFGLDFAVDF
jgi:hypothetical protein